MKTLRVLVVDDDEDVAASLAEYLELDGCDVDIRNTGVGGRDAALATRYDQIIMDVSLPDISGIECMTSILGADPQVRILLVTGHNAAQIESQAPELTGVEILTKPLDLADLSQRMEKLAASLSQ